MDKDASLFSSLDLALENNIYVDDDSVLNIIGHGDVSCQWGQIIDVFHVPYLRENLLLASQLTETGNIVELWIDWFFIKNMKDKFIISDRLLDPTDHLSVSWPTLIWIWDDESHRLGRRT